MVKAGVARSVVKVSEINAGCGTLALYGPWTQAGAP